MEKSGRETKSSRDAIKALHLQCLDIGGTSGLPTLAAGLSLGANLQFLTSVDKHSQRVSFTNGQRNCPEEGDTSALSLSGIKECKYTTSKFLLEHNGGLGRQEDEMRKEDGGAAKQVDVEPVHHYGFTENLLHLISCPRVFQFEHKMPPGEFRQWAGEETGEGKRRGRKMRA